MIFNEVTKRLFDSVVKKLQGNIDSIQTTSTASLSTPGWYRVAKYTASGSNLYGNRTNTVELTIKRAAGSGTGETIKLLCLSRHNKQQFCVLYADIGSAHHFTKVRYTYDGTAAYLEIYYDTDIKYTTTFGIDSPWTGAGTVNPWKAITPVLTEETVDGVTVTTTYDIPANASPVNSEDLAKGTYPMGVVGKDRFILYPEGGTFDSTENLTGQLRITLPQTWTNTTISFKVRIRGLSVNDYAEYDISGYIRVATSAWGYSIAESRGNSTKGTLPVTFAHDGEKCVVCIGNVDTTWQSNKVQITDVMVGHYGTAYDNWATGWNIDIVADNSDLTVSATVENPNTLTTALAGYLPLTGGTLTGGLTLADVGGDEGGELRFGSPETNTDFAGTIALDIYKNMVRFYAEHSGKTKAFHVDFSSMKEGDNFALHTGNSNAIVFTEDDTTAPSDTTALWAHL